MAWVNAEDPAVLLAGLAEVAAALGLPAGDAQAAGQAVRHRMEADGDRCLLVFDNAVDPDLLRPFLPAAGHSGGTRSALDRFRETSIVDRRVRGDVPPQPLPSGERLF